MQTAIEALTYVNNILDDVVEVFRLGRDDLPVVRTLGDTWQDWRANRPRPRPMVVAKVAGGIAHLVSIGRLVCLHTMHITKRLNREGLFVYGEPPKAQVRRFIRDVANDRAPHHEVKYRKPGWARFMGNPETVLECVEVKAVAKSIRQIPVASKTWARPFARASSMNRGRLIGNLKHTRATRFCAMLG